MFISCLLGMNNKDVETYGNRLENKEEMTAVVLCWGFQAVLVSSCSCLCLTSQMILWLP